MSGRVACEELYLTFLRKSHVNNQSLEQEKVALGADFAHSSRKIRKNYSLHPLLSLYRGSRSTINRKGSRDYRHLTRRKS